MRGVIADPSGATVSGAEVDLLDPDGAVAGKVRSDGEGAFQLQAPHAGPYTLVVSEPGFETVKTPVVIAAPAAALVAKPGAPLPPALLHIVLPIASFSTSVQVSAEQSQDLTSTEDNRDSSVMTAGELKALPIFDNDYAGAMSAFLDDSATGTGGSGLLVDGVEANRATVSTSAVQEVRINQDPYSAQYYWPGRGQMEIVTKAASEHYHGQFNFTYRNSGMNAQNALAPSKPFEQRQNYEGHVTGPIPRARKSGFLASFNRVLFDQEAVVHATVLDPTDPSQPLALHSNVSAPQRDTEFSVRGSHQFGERHSAYAQYSYQDWTGRNLGAGGQTLATAGYNSEYREDDTVIHADSTLSPVLLNQLSIVAEHDSSRNTNAVEGPRMSVSGDFLAGSAQVDAFSTEYNFRIYDMATWTHGRHTIKIGAGTPHISRRAFDDHTNQLGTYTFGPTEDSNGNVLETALENYAAHLPSGYSQNTGDTHFVYHQQEMGAFIQDQFKVNDRFSITPGLRYDWQNFLATRRLGFAPRVSFALVLDEESKTIVRGGGGIYYDRVGSGPLLDLVRFESARRRSVLLSLDPATLPSTGCVPITLCLT
ncbi:MAG: TonB-dependent receptor, partial [Terracidiphilus sp.]